MMETIDVVDDTMTMDDDDDDFNISYSIERLVFVWYCNNGRKG